MPHIIDTILDAGKWHGLRINQNSFLMACDRSLIERGKLGHIAQWVCDQCGPIDEPISVCVDKGGRWSPQEWDYLCPTCDRVGCCGENNIRNRGFKVTKRGTVPVCEMRN